MKLRIKNGDDRKVEGMIHIIAKKYDLPEGVKTIKIWQER